jgi:RNA polymerase sigma-70 factor (ECF subfamily)
MLAHQEAVFRFAYLLLGDADDAEDVAQETFVRAWENVRRFDVSRPLRPWLLRIAANLCSNRRRSASRHLDALVRAFRRDPAPTPGIEDVAATKSEAQQLRIALRSLSIADQQILYLRYFLDLPVEETGEALNIPSGTAKSRSSRALDRLRETLMRAFPDVLAGGDQ